MPECTMVQLDQIVWFVFKIVAILVGGIGCGGDIVILLNLSITFHRRWLTRYLEAKNRAYELTHTTWR